MARGLAMKIHMKKSFLFSRLDTLLHISYQKVLRVGFDGSKADSVLSLVTNCLDGRIELSQ